MSVPDTVEQGACSGMLSYNLRKRDEELGGEGAGFRVVCGKGVGIQAAGGA